MHGTKRIFGIPSFFAICILIFGTSCTRQQNEASKLSIMLPQKTTRAFGGLNALAHVVINVSGDGIQKQIFYQWDAHLANGGIATPPSEHTLEIPQGANRLIQVLAVYVTTDTQKQTFFYGDVSKSLSSANETVAITVGNISGSTPSYMGRVYGRYFTSASGGPSGDLNTKYFPPGGKPAMQIETGMIMNGWFEVMAANAVPFTYETSAGMKLFGGAVDLSSPVFNPSAATLNVSRVMIPIHDRNENWGGGHDWKLEEAGAHVYGFFADPSVPAAVAAAGGMYVCRPSTLNALTKIARHEGGLPSAPRAFPLTGELNTALPAAATLIDETAANSSYYVTGGQSSGSHPCYMPASEYTSYLKYASAYFDGMGNDGAKPFFGPYIRRASGYPYDITMASPVPSQATFSVSILPGLTSQIDKLTVFKSTRASARDLDYEFFSCSEAQNGAHGFTQVGTFAPVGSDFSMPLNFTNAETSTATFAICAGLGQKTYSRSLLIKDFGMAVQPKYLRMEMSGHSYDSLNPSHLRLTAGICYPVTFVIYQGGAHSTNTSGSNLMITGFDANFSVNSDCTGGTPSNVTILNGMGASGTVYYRPSMVSTYTLPLTVSSATIPYDENQHQIFVRKPKVRIAGPPAQALESCIRMSASLVDQEGHDLIYPGNYPNAVALEQGSSDYYVTLNGACSGGTQAIVFSGGSASFYLKGFSSNLSPGDSRAITIDSASMISFDVDPVTVSFRADASPAVAWDLIGLPGSLVPGKCYPASVVLKNFDGGAVPAKSNYRIPFQFARDSMVLFNDSWCNSSADEIVIAQGDSSATLSLMVFQPSASAPLEARNGLAAWSGSGTPIMNIPTAPYPTSENYIFMQYHDFGNAKAIGAHDFPGNVISMPLRYPAAATLECSTDGSIFSSGTCSGLVDGSRNFQWTQAMASAPTPIYFRSVLNGIPSAPFNFNPTIAYGNDFRVFPCDSTIGSNMSLNDPTVTGTFTSLPNGTLCINPGVTLTSSADLILNWSARDQVILGSTLGTSKIVLNSGHEIQLDGTAGNISRRFVIANVTIEKTAVGALSIMTKAGIDTPNYGTEIWIYNNQISQTVTGDQSPFISLVYPTSAIRARIDRNRFTMDGSRGVESSCSGSSAPAPNMTINDNVFTATSEPSQAVVIVGGSNGIASIDVRGNKLTGNISLLQASGATVGFPIQDLNILENNLVGTTAGAASPISLGNYVSANIKGNYLEQTSATFTYPMIGFDGNSGMLLISGNHLVMNADSYFIKEGSSSSPRAITGFSGNQFVRKAPTSANGFIGTLASAGVFTIDKINTDTSVTGRNPFCATAVGGTWTWTAGATWGGDLAPVGSFNACSAAGVVLSGNSCTHSCN